MANVSENKMAEILVTARPNRVCQCASMTPRIAANHRSAIESIKSPIQVPNIALAELGAQPRNQRLSPGLKWRYMIMLPTFMAIPWSMFISMPLSWATAPAIRNARRTHRPAMRRMIDICVSDSGAQYQWHDKLRGMSTQHKQTQTRPAKAYLFGTNTDSDDEPGLLTTLTLASLGLGVTHNSFKA